uniref:pancreatic elastase n=1 Tax=Leptobrachium leishanense TaxID=445787 RepID=A0A8C5LXD5_9ANUR
MFSLLLAALLLQGHCKADIQFTQNGHVVGRTDAVPNSWPSQVSLQVFQNNVWLHICGGSLIRTKWVLTAAHCVDRPSTYRVVLGEHHLFQNEGTEQAISVDKVIYHAKWNPIFALNHDIAVLRLATNAVLNNAVQLAKLPSPGVMLSNEYPCLITGWGALDGKKAVILQQAPVPVVSHDICSSFSYRDQQVKTNMVCAGGNGIHPGCSADSGGPLNCPINGVYEVHGLRSSGSPGCNVDHAPGVYTRVSTYLTWINNTITINA